LQLIIAKYIGIQKIKSNYSKLSIKNNRTDEKITNISIDYSAKLFYR